MTELFNQNLLELRKRV